MSNIYNKDTCSKWPPIVLSPENRAIAHSYTNNNAARPANAARTMELVPGRLAAEPVNVVIDAVALAMGRVVLTAYDTEGMAVDLEEGIGDDVGTTVTTL